MNYGLLAARPPTLTQFGQVIFMRKRIEGFWLTGWLRETPLDERARVAPESQARFVDGRWRTDVTATLDIREAMRELPAALAEPDGEVMPRP